MSISILFFLFIIFVSQIVSLSMAGWNVTWLFLEISTLSSLPLISSSSMNSMNMESAMKYFIWQSIGGILLFLSGNMVYESMHTNFIMHGLLVWGFFMKLGLFPFHYWVLSVLYNVKPLGMYVILVMTKPAPAFLLTKYSQDYWTSNYWLMGTILAMSTIIGFVHGWSNTMMTGILASSSISNMGNMMAPLSVSLLGVYMAFYLFIMLSVTISIQVRSQSMLVLSLLQMSGIPLSLLFLPKIFLFYDLLCHHCYLALLMLILSSAMWVFLYLRISIAKWFESYNSINLAHHSLLYLSLFLFFMQNSLLVMLFF